MRLYAEPKLNPKSNIIAVLETWSFPPPVRRRKKYQPQRVLCCQI